MMEDSGNDKYQEKVYEVGIFWTFSSSYRDVEIPEKTQHYK